jgi:hypothetical protein
MYSPRWHGCSSENTKGELARAYSAGNYSIFPPATHQPTTTTNGLLINGNENGNEERIIMHVYKYYIVYAIISVYHRIVLYTEHWMVNFCRKNLITRITIILWYLFGSKGPLGSRAQ